MGYNETILHIGIIYLEKMSMLMENIELRT